MFQIRQRSYRDANVCGLMTCSFPDRKIEHVSAYATEAYIDLWTKYAPSYSVGLWSANLPLQEGGSWLYWTGRLAAVAMSTAMIVGCGLSVCTCCRKILKNAPDGVGRRKESNQLFGTRKNGMPRPLYAGDYERVWIAWTKVKSTRR